MHSEGKVLTPTDTIHKKEIRSYAYSFMSAKDLTPIMGCCNSLPH
jgi:hypothetical protein